MDWMAWNFRGRASSLSRMPSRLAAAQQSAARNIELFAANGGNEGGASGGNEAEVPHPGDERIS